MAIDGVYSARFISNSKEAGAGIVVIDGATLHGGDTDYLYKGKYRFVDDQGGISVTVDVDNYSGRRSAVVGPFDRFRLTLTGKTAQQGFLLSGAVDGYADRTIQIDLKRISDLVTE